MDVIINRQKSRPVNEPGMQVIKKQRSYSTSAKTARRAPIEAGGGRISERWIGALKDRIFKTGEAEMTAETCESISQTGANQAKFISGDGNGMGTCNVGRSASQLIKWRKIEKIRVPKTVRHWTEDILEGWLHMSWPWKIE